MRRSALTLRGLTPLILALVIGQASAARQVTPTRWEQVGYASIYGREHQCRRTADGERFDLRAPTAAVRHMPLPAMVEVTDLRSGRSIRLRANDRGPFIRSRVIDLSVAAAAGLGLSRDHPERVRVRYLGPAPQANPPRRGACR